MFSTRVIGATKAGYAKTKSDFIYYIDPKVSQKANSNLVIFAVSYKTFISRLVEINGIKPLGGANEIFWNDAPSARFIFFREKTKSVIKKNEVTENKSQFSL